MGLAPRTVVWDFSNHPLAQERGDGHPSKVLQVYLGYEPRPTGKR
jgi:hypothetical protein